MASTTHPATPPQTPNTNDGTGAAPYLRFDLNVGTIASPPPHGTAPKGDATEITRALKEAGFRGIQGGDAAACKALGMRRTWWGRVDGPTDADQIARTATAEGYDCVAVHVGTGFEDDATALSLLETTITASQRHGVPLYVETHRATVTNDPWRTLKFTERLPGLRFNGDFSHWYTGSEMIYGDFERKLDLLAPVLDRVRFIHGRIGSPGCIQVDLGSSEEAERLGFVGHFRAMWTRVFRGFRATAVPGDFICFTPELLHSGMYYQRAFRNASREWVEEGDRWQQALLYLEIAGQCWEEAAPN